MDEQAMHEETERAIQFRRFSEVAKKIAEEVWYEFFRRKGFNNLMEEMPSETVESIKFCLKERAMTLLQTFTGTVVVPNVRFDFVGMAMFAKHTLRLDDVEAVEFVNRQFHEFVEKLNALQTNDFIVSAMLDEPATPSPAAPCQTEPRCTCCEAVKSGRIKPRNMTGHEFGCRVHDFKMSRMGLES